MTPRISIDDQTLEQIQKNGELQVIDNHGVPLVVMTASARENLEKRIYDASEWTDDEKRSVVNSWIEDPKGWGAPGMEIYDTLYGDEPCPDES